MHHVPYAHALHSGKTVIQHLYDTHYQGAEEAAGFVRAWISLKGRIDEHRYNEVLALLEYQAGHAVVWRDAICQWFLKTSGIPDKKGRAGLYPNRIEAESMTLAGYEVMDVSPWEGASGAKAIRCTGPADKGTASFTYGGRPGWYDLAVQYFDQDNGKATYGVFVADQPVDTWVADNDLPTRGVNSHSSSRRTIKGVALRPGVSLGYPPS